MPGVPAFIYRSYNDVKRNYLGHFSTLLETAGTVLR